MSHTTALGRSDVSRTFRSFVFPSDHQGAFSIQRRGFSRPVHVLHLGVIFFFFFYDVYLLHARDACPTDVVVVLSRLSGTFDVLPRVSGVGPMRHLTITDAIVVTFSPMARLFLLPKHGVVRLLRVVEMARKWRRTSCNVDGTSLCVCVSVSVCGWVWHQVKGRRAILVPSLLDPIVQSKGKERKGEGATVHRRWIRLWVRRDPRQVEDGTRSTTIQKEKKEDRRG